MRNLHWMDPRRSAALITLLAVLAGCGTSAVTPTPMPSQPTPTDPATTSSPGAAIHLDVANATGSRVTIDVMDASGRLVTASSGTPGDGASVEPSTLLVANDDPTTLRLTWVGGPCDSADVLIDRARRLASSCCAEPACSGDSLVTDRVPSWSSTRRSRPTTSRPSSRMVWTQRADDAGHHVARPRHHGPPRRGPRAGGAHRATGATSVSPSGRLVDVGGHRLHLRITGEGRPGPTVILDAGMISFSSNWAWVQPELEKVVPRRRLDRAAARFERSGSQAA